MRCGLLDLTCHAQNAIWEWWAGVGFMNKALIVIGIVALILGALRGFLSILHRVGGWPAVAGAAIAVLGIVLAVLPRKPKGKDDFTGEVDGPDADGPFRFGVDRKKPPRRTAKRAPGKRRFNPDTNAWEEK